MVDLHTHILPHLDDGAFDLETSVRMADLAARSGVFHMAAGGAALIWHRLGYSRIQGKF